MRLYISPIKRALQGHAQLVNFCIQGLGFQ